MTADTLTVNVTTRVSRTLLEIMRKRLRRARAEVVELEHVVSVLGRLAGKKVQETGGTRRKERG